MNQFYTYTHAAHQNTTQSFMIASGGDFTLNAESTPAEYIGSTATPVTMSSKEIAELTGKEHYNVIRDIRKMLGDLGEPTALSFEGSYTDSTGRGLTCFNLPRREVDILLTGYSAPLRAKVIDRWHELEAAVVKQQFVVPTTFHGALRLAAELEEQRAVLTHQVSMLEHRIEEDAPTAEFYGNLSEATGVLSVNAVAKILGTGQNRLFRYMRNHKILMSEVDLKNLPNQEYQNAGLFKVKWNKLKPRPMFTGKGIIWMREFIERHGRDGL